MVGEAITEFGRVDILVNNAGMRASKPFTEMTVEDWREVNGVNMDGPFFACQAVVPGMIERGWGRIINVSGLNAFQGHVPSGRTSAQERWEHWVLLGHWPRNSRSMASWSTTSFQERSTRLAE